MKNFIACLLIVFSVSAVIFGGYLPFVKSQIFIKAIQTNINSVSSFRTIYDGVFNFPSPIGGEESVKFLVNNIDGLINNQKNKSSEEAMRQIVAYVEPKIFPDNVRHLLLMGNIYTNFWLEYHHPEDFTKAVDYYNQILAIGPDLPHALYSLLSLYEQAGDKVNMKLVGEKILIYWPDDQVVKGLIAK